MTSVAAVSQAHPFEGTRARAGHGRGALSTDEGRGPPGHSHGRVRTGGRSSTRRPPEDQLRQGRATAKPVTGGGRGRCSGGGRIWRDEHGSGRTLPSCKPGQASCSRRADLAGRANGGRAPDGRIRRDEQGRAPAGGAAPRGAARMLLRRTSPHPYEGPHPCGHRTVRRHRILRNCTRTGTAPITGTAPGTGAPLIQAPRHCLPGRP